MTFIWTYAITKFTRNRRNQEKAPSSADFNLGCQVLRQNHLMQPIQSLFPLEGPWAPETLPKMASWGATRLAWALMPYLRPLPLWAPPQICSRSQDPRFIMGQVPSLRDPVFSYVKKPEWGGKIGWEKNDQKNNFPVVKNFPIKVLTKYIQSPFLLGHWKLS